MAAAGLSAAVAAAAVDSAVALSTAASAAAAAAAVALAAAVGSAAGDTRGCHEIVTAFLLFGGSSCSIPHFISRPDGNTHRGRIQERCFLRQPNNERELVDLDKPAKCKRTVGEPFLCLNLQFPNGQSRLPVATVWMALWMSNRQGTRRRDR